MKSILSPNTAQKAVRQALRQSAEQRQAVGVRCLTSGTYRVPKAFNEPNLHYARDSPERERLSAALSTLRQQLPMKVPAIGGSQPSNNQSNGDAKKMPMPSEHATVFAEFETASETDINKAIQSALDARQVWRDMPFTDRAAIFLRAADLVSGKYRCE